MRVPILMLAAMALAACSDTEPTRVTATDPLPVQAFSPQANEPLVVATRNLYLGGDIDRILGAQTPQEIPILTMQTWLEIQASRFPERARAMAKEFAADPPHVIGLQEAPLFRLQDPGDAHLGNPVVATDVVMDYLQIFVGALAEQGLTYHVATLIENVDVELPMVTSPTTLADIRFTDRDAVLVRSDVNLLATDAANFAAGLTFPVAGAIPVEFKRGWTEVIIEHRRKTYRLVNAHLEIQRFQPIQEAQMTELMARLEGVPEPVFLVGDLNSDADGSQTASYAMAIDAGFLDTWTQKRNPPPGETCCYNKDLTGGLEKMVERIDFVLYRDPADRSSGKISGKVWPELLGDDPGDLTESGLWPSDHRGLRVGMRLPQKSIKSNKSGKSGK